MPLALEGHPVAVEHIVPASCMRALCAGLRTKVNCWA